MASESSLVLQVSNFTGNSFDTVFVTYYTLRPLKFLLYRPKILAIIKTDDVMELTAKKDAQHP